jgi:hypothetical protein
VARCSATTGAGSWTFGLDSIFVPDRCSCRITHIGFLWRGIDLFVFQRLPQFSNNFTSQVESDPGLDFESQGSAKEHLPGLCLPLASRQRLQWHSIAVSLLFLGYVIREKA